MFKQSGLRGLFLTILVVVFGIGSIAFFVVGSNEKKLRLKAEKELLELIKIKSKLEKSNSELSLNVEKLEGEIREKNAEIDTVTELKNNFKKELNLHVEMLQRMELELDSLKKRNNDLSKKSKEISSRYNELKHHVDKIVKTKENLETKLNHIAGNREVELGSIVVEADNVPQTPTVEGIDGKILLINTEYNFVIINLGRDQGVKEGDAIRFYRDGQNAGDARVDKLYDNMAACAIITPHIIDQLNINDQAYWMKG